MKYTMQELKDIYREASARSESEDYEHIAERVECVLIGETKCCRFQLFEKDLISACFVEDDDVCIVNGTYDEHVKRYGNHAELVMKMYGVKKAKAQTAETAVTETEQSEKAETVEQTEVEETAEIETAKPETAETDDSGFEYYSVETAYEVDFRDRQKEVFKTYSEAEKTAGDNIILEVDLIVRNDKKAVSEHDKEVFEDETDEIECRCIWYHHNGVKGMIAQDTKRVIKKPETAEVSKEVKEQFEKQKTSFKFYDVSIAYQVERYVNCGNLKYVQLGTYSDYAKAVKAAQEAIENWGEENIYFHTVEFAKRSSEPIKNNKKAFKSETHEIDYYWISARLTDTKECGYVNIDSPIRIPIETSEQSEIVEQTEVEETAKTETAETAEQEAMETVEGISKTETTTETDDSGFTYYSVKVAYEAMDDKKRSIVFMNYSEALEVAEHFTETWGGDKAIVIAVNFVIRNDRQPESERDKRVLEDETAEIERRCVPYNYLGLRGYVSIEDKQIVNEDIA